MKCRLRRAVKTRGPGRCWESRGPGLAAEGPALHTPRDRRVTVRT